MPLRSSSSPILGSPLSSFFESPNRDFDNCSSKNNKQLSTFDYNLKKISFYHGGQSHLSSFSCNSSPVSHSFVGFSDFDSASSCAGSRGFRRARSEGNLEALAAAASCDIDDFCTTKPLTRRSQRPSMSVLETIPSFSIYNSRGGSEEEQANEEGKPQQQEKEGDCITAVGSGEFSFAKNKNMGLIVEEDLSSVVEEAEDSRSPPLYLARGIGIEMGGAGGGAGGGGVASGIGFSSDGFGEGGNPEGHQVEEYYKRMVEENPCNPLFLRNYAQFLHQSKGDLQGAEYYYSRAILVDPTDGEIMSQYAKLVWELYHDRNTATNYFERAVQAAPGNSHVLGAYASFLWETEEDEEEGSQSQDLAGAPAYHTGTVASASG